MTTSKDIRQRLVNALRLDLIGPDNGTSLERETLPQLPSRWYLTGFLVPLSADDSQRMDETMLEGVEAVDDRTGADDEQTPDATAAKRAYLPSSMGMSLLIGPDCAGASSWPSGTWNAPVSNSGRRDIPNMVRATCI